jgi:hypothetical protein
MPCKDVVMTTTNAGGIMQVFKEDHPAIGLVRVAEGTSFRVTMVRSGEGFVIYSGAEVDARGVEVVADDGEGNFVTEFVAVSA